jgi:hypothetical protein
VVIVNTPAKPSAAAKNRKNDSSALLVTMVGDVSLWLSRNALIVHVEPRDGPAHRGRVGALAQVPGYFSAAWFNEKLDPRRTIAIYLVTSHAAQGHELREERGDDRALGSRVQAGEHAGGDEHGVVRCGRGDEREDAVEDQRIEHDAAAPDPVAEDAVHPAEGCSRAHPSHGARSSPHER